MRLKRSSLKKQRRKLRELVENHSQNIHLQIEKLIQEKARQLLVGGTQINQRLLSGRGTHINSTDGDGQDLHEKCKGTQNNNLDKRLNQVPPEIGRCPISGVDISMQDEGTKTLGRVGLRYYLEHDRDTFDAILAVYMPKSYRNAPLATQIHETYHAIRDKNRPSRKQQIEYHPQQLRVDFF